MNRRLFLLVPALFAALVAACTTGNIGNIRTSPEVARQFQNVESNPSYRYWYLNQENSPYGVIGLDREYGFEGGPLWNAVATDSATFKKVVGLVGSFPVAGSYTTGFTIFDPAGRPIGVWYSSLNAGVIVDPATKTVSLATRTPWRAP
jgi:hypothetical protein